MAKQDDSQEIKRMLQDLFRAIKQTNDMSKEQIRINRELMKVMSLLNSGFAQNAEDAHKLIETIKDDGFSVTDEFIKKWAKERKITNSDLKKIKERFKEIDDINDDIIDSAKDYTDLLEEQITSFEDNIDLSSKLLRSQEKITSAIEASRKQAAALGGSTQNISNITEKLLQKKVNLTGMFDGMFNNMSEGKSLLDDMKSDMDSLLKRAVDSKAEVNFKFNPLTNELDQEVNKALKNIDEEKTKRLQGLSEYYSKNKELQSKMAKQMAAQKSTKDIKFNVDTSEIITASGKLEKGTLEYKKVLSSLTKIVSRNKLTNEVKNNLQEMVELLGRGVNLTEEENNKLIKYRDLLDDSNKIIFDQFHARLKDVELMEEDIKKEQNRLILVEKYTDQLMAARNIVGKIGTAFDYIDSVLPAGVSDFLGISKVSLMLLDAHKKGVEKFAKHIADGGDLTKSMAVYMGEIGPSITKALNPMLLLVTAGMLLFNTLKKTVETYKEMANDMGISILQAKKLLDTQLDILTSQKNQFTTMQDIKDIQTEMIQSGRSLYSMNTKGSKELVLSLSEVGKVFGYGVTTATQLQTIFNNIGADDTLALNLQQNLGFMAEMVGLSPQIISQDLIDSAEEVSIYFAGMPDKAAKAAIQIRRMGMSLKQAGQIAQKMLDLEGFMTDMYELQAMTSGGIDFSNAFDKGLTGDIEGMTKDIMSDIGTMAQYNKMDYLTRMKIAKTLGMSVDELGKSVKLNEQLSQFSGMEKEALEGNVDRLGDISKLNKDQIRERLQQLQSTDRLGVAWEKIKGVFLKAIIPLAESFADAIDAISPIIDVIVGALKGVSMVIKIISPLVKGILLPFKLVGDVLSKITGYLDESADSASGLGAVVKGLGSTFDFLGKAAYYIGAGIGTWTLLFKLPTVLGSITSMFKNILSFIPGIGTIFSSITNGFGGIFGSLGKKSKDAAKESTDPVVGMTNKIEVSMVGMVDRIKSSMDDMVNHIKTSISNATKSVNKAINTSPTERMLSDLRKDATGTTKTVSDQAKKSAEDVSNTIQTTSKKSKKNLGDIKNSASNLIPTAPIKESFKTMTDIGTKAIAILATRSAMSMLFTQKEGEQQMSETSKHIQGLIELAAMGGSTVLAQVIQESIEKVTVKKLEKKIETVGGGFSKAIKKTTDKGIFDKMLDYGKSAFEKLTAFGKSTVPDVGDVLADNFDKVEQKTDPIKKSIKTVQKRPIIREPKVNIPVPNDAEKSVTTLTSVFDKLKTVIKSAWDSIKSVLLDVVKFLGDVLKSVTESVGKSVENLLKGIGNGLSSFKTDAVKGAAALLIVSGALWVTSKALENFANVSWESVGKGLVALGGLTLAAMILGKASGQILLGSIAIAILGASLIPAAYALNMFNDVDWSSLAKAGVALIGLGVAGTVLGAMVVPMLLGAVAIAALGAALIPMSFALEKFNDIGWDSLAKAGVALVGFGLAAASFGLAAPLILTGAGVLAVASISLLAFAGSVIAINVGMRGLDSKPLKELATDLINLTNVSVTSLFSVSAGITAISAAMAGLSVVGVGTTVAKLFGGDIIADLERLGSLANPLSIVNDTISKLSDSIVDLSMVLMSANFDNIKKLNDIDIKTLDDNINQQINTVSGKSTRYEEPTIEYKIAPQQTQVATPMAPKKESVAQNVKINSIGGLREKSEDADSNILGQTVPNLSNNYYGNTENTDIYNRPEMNTKRIEMLLMRLIQLNEAALQHELSVNIDGQKVGKISKKYNNN